MAWVAASSWTMMSQAPFPSQHMKSVIIPTRLRLHPWTCKPLTSPFDPWEYSCNQRTVLPPSPNLGIPWCEDAHWMMEGQSSFGIRGILPFCYHDALTSIPITSTSIDIPYKSSSALACSLWNLHLHDRRLYVFHPFDLLQRPDWTPLQLELFGI